MTNNATDAGVGSIDWACAYAELNRRGWTVVRSLLPRGECAGLIRGYEDSSLYRSRVIMSRHHFGLGEYKYYAYPLPDTVERMRNAVYPRLVPLANQWADALGSGTRYPDELEEFLRHCHEIGQVRPTPLILRYGKGDYNCLHQDLYGELHFPLQLAILLNGPAADFEGGEFVLTEQRPRMQSRPHVVPLARGDGVIFAVNERPVRGTRGLYRVRMRHGVSALSAGHRHTLGIIFHDAA